MEELNRILGENALEVLQITAGLDHEGLAQVKGFAAGVKARAEYEREKHREEKEAS